MNANQPIRIIVTGGTFDKQYDAVKGDLTFRNSHLPEILRAVRCTVDCEMQIEKLVDSLFMGQDDRMNIRQAAADCDEKHIVITHGTDTMAKTAKLLGEAALDKTIILTGAMVPYAFGASDALFNLGSAIAFAQSLTTGVYIAMNGRCFTWDNVTKDTQLGIFKQFDE